jgi:hypothetical protein
MLAMPYRRRWSSTFPRGWFSWFKQWQHGQRTSASRGTLLRTNYMKSSTPFVCSEESLLTPFLIQLLSICIRNVAT